MKMSTVNLCLIDKMKVKLITCFHNSWIYENISRNFLGFVFLQDWSFLIEIKNVDVIITEKCDLKPSEKWNIIGPDHLGRFLVFSDFSKESLLWNKENKSVLKYLKFWEVSGDEKTSKFWKLQLSISCGPCGTQKYAKIPRPGAKMIWSFCKKIFVDSYF